MLSRSQIKHIQSLQRKKYRTLHQQYFVEGPKIVEEAIIENALDIEIFANKIWVEENESLLQKYAPPVTIINDKDLDRISYLKTANKVLAMLPTKDKEIPSKIMGLNIFLENIQDPGNLGTIIRCADWFGAQGVYCSSNCADVFNPKVVQACMGSNFHIPVYYVEPEVFIKNLSIPIYAATISGQNLYDTTVGSDAMILIGNESKGLSDSIQSMSNNAITIPKKGKAESLNAANASAVILSYFANNLK